MLISPNSVVGMPAESKEGLSTTIVQQAGSILLEVEKRNVKHFEVETPYLAAVVEGTQFSVTVNGDSTRVGVLRGQVEVSDFKTGQIAQVTIVVPKPMPKPVKKDDIALEENKIEATKIAVLRQPAPGK